MVQLPWHAGPGHTAAHDPIQGELSLMSGEFHSVAMKARFEPCSNSAKVNRACGEQKCQIGSTSADGL